MMEEDVEEKEVVDPIRVEEDILKKLHKCWGMRDKKKMSNKLPK